MAEAFILQIKDLSIFKKNQKKNHVGLVQASHKLYTFVTMYLPVGHMITVNYYFLFI